MFIGMIPNWEHTSPNHYQNLQHETIMGSVQQKYFSSNIWEFAQSHFLKLGFLIFLDGWMEMVETLELNFIYDIKARYMILRLEGLIKFEPEFWSGFISWRGQDSVADFWSRLAYKNLWCDLKAITFRWNQSTLGFVLPFWHCLYPL